jgi:glycosyltransferase involved in cell wall biosynthesis
MITYNHAPYIAQAIECVLAQKTNFPFELVIGEDCSTDGTREIVLEYAKRYPDIIRVITSEKNVGMIKNSIRTDDACKGKYIAWCEGDDYWHNSEKLQKQIDYLEKDHTSGLVCSDYNLHDTNNAKTIVKYREHSGRRIQTPNINDILAGNAEILTCTVVARKQLVTQIKNSDPYLHKNGNFKMGDTQLWAEISLISKIYCIDESLATHQILKESATQSSDFIKKQYFWLSNAEMCLYLCQKHKLPDKITKNHEKNWRCRSLQLAFIEKNFELAKIALNKYPTKISFNDRLWYLGTKYSIVRMLLNYLTKHLHLGLKNNSQKDA